MLTDKHIDIVKSTIPLLENAGPALTTYFYQRLFSHNPELKDIFNMSNQDTGRQQVALFEAIAAYAKNIENLSALTTAVERIAQKHTSFNIQAAHYAVVGHHLIETLRELAPDAFTADVEEAWTNAYQFLAGIFINREAELYQQRLAEVGGWQGARAFKVIDKVVESELVKSFIFAPVDEQAIIGFTPGQYLGLEVKPTDSDYKEIRQYSLSDKANGNTYRISVKREQQGVPGKVSNYLHDSVNVGDEVKLYPPAGDFFFVDRQTPTVLISAGVGITPMQGMLETLAEEKHNQPVHFLHACEGSEQHSFAHRTQQLINDNNWQQNIWYRNEEAQQSHINKGMMDFSAVDLPTEKGNFYLCGPIAFMQFAKQNLLALGVGEGSIHYEVFGPHATL
ncbi:NO-inducible flavohemoprotein [Colwellia sp. Arc7-635]|uniref:NO-inducible flavohemoprotein n=1 Tax=Colwellia sp. Arc7-635 TaxID=2497879 RepID=UPI000F85340B|nr:NO-inducible flavohemoprotein [Colwellia sp. Arc7-635]AZQ85152.1 NO-inducible flavohemoprotein [Colwellia sp. Arc7-635]